MSEKITVVGPPVTPAELAEIIEAGQTGGVDAAFKKHLELIADKEKIRQTLRAQRDSRTTRVKSKLP